MLATLTTRASDSAVAARVTKSRGKNKPSAQGQPATTTWSGRSVLSGHGLAGRAYAIMHRRIVGGELAPGQVISRRKLAAELGISFLPASEAFLRLEWDGLLESRPRAGTRLRIPRRQDVEGHFVICEALDAQTAMMFAERASTEERSALIKLAGRVDALQTQKDCDWFHYLALHDELHLRIAECTRCDVLFEAICKASAVTTAWLASVRPVMSGKAPACHGESHKELLRVLSTRHPTAAVESMRIHTRCSMENVMQGLEPYFLCNQNNRTYSRTIGKPLPA